MGQYQVQAIITVGSDSYRVQTNSEFRGGQPFVSHATKGCLGMWRQGTVEPYKGKARQCKKLNEALDTGEARIQWLTLKAKLSFWLRQKLI